MNYNLTEEQLKDLMHRSWLRAKSFYKGQTDEYFYDFYDAEIKQLMLGGVVGRSEQFYCTCSRAKGLDHDEEGMPYCIECQKPVQ